MDFNTDQRIFTGLPGLWIDHQDRDWAGFAKLLLDLALGQCQEAAVCCLQFEPLIKRRLHGHLSTWSTGQLTDEENCLLSIYAKGVVYGIETARDLLLVLSNDVRAIKLTKDACLAFASQFEVTKHIRDSLQHFDERAEGQSFKKRIPTSLIVLGSFVNRRFVVTSAQGTETGIEVSTPVMARARELFDEVIWSFKWLGPGNVPVQRPVVNMR